MANPTAFKNRMCQSLAVESLNTRQYYAPGPVIPALVRMVYRLDFNKLLTYGAGKPGITVAVTLHLKEKRTDFTAKIDTGADRCIFERKYGEQLELDIELGVPQRFSTATGIFLTYGHEVTLQVAGLQFDSMVFFAAEESFTRNVVGRFGWLDRVVLGLVDYEGKLYLRPYGVE